MKVERKGEKFNLEMNLDELVTLFCIVSEEKMSVDMPRFRFSDPAGVSKIIREFHKKTHKLMETRTPEEKKNNRSFFQVKSTV